MGGYLDMRELSKVLRNSGGDVGSSSLKQSKCMGGVSHGKSKRRKLQQWRV